MRTALDCLPCFIRQSLDAARMISPDDGLPERIIREILRWTSEMNLDDPPAVMGQRIHRRLRELAGNRDPYRAVKERLNRMALNLLPDLEALVSTSFDPPGTALRLAAAGNVIDLGVQGAILESEVRQAVRRAIAEPLAGDEAGFWRAVAEARSILYLADNAGEIVFDRLLIERLSPERVTLVVRGGPVINDATREDAAAAGLDRLVDVIDNGSDAPGTILADCSPDFRRRFVAADLILAKGQGNYETLNEEPGEIYFLLKAKCPVIAGLIGVPIGTHVARSPQSGRAPARGAGAEPVET